MAARASALIEYSFLSLFALMEPELRNFPQLITSVSALRNRRRLSMIPDNYRFRVWRTRISMSVTSTVCVERAEVLTRVVVEISDARASNDLSAELVTYALGSCIAVIMYDPRRRVGGMLHFMLPHSQTAPHKAADHPAMFADTGVPLLFEKMAEFGCQRKQLIVKIAGGGRLYDADGQFDIGRRNYLMLRKLFDSNRIVISAEDIGGRKSRTVRFAVKTGRVVVRSGCEEVEL